MSDFWRGFRYTAGGLIAVGVLMGLSKALVFVIGFVAGLVS